MKILMKIRTAKNHDAHRIYEFLCEKEEFLFDFREFEVNYRICIADSDNIYLVAVNDRNDAVGYISCHDSVVLHEGGMVYEVKELFIEKKYRKTGIGKMLMRHLQEMISTRNYQSLAAVVEAKREDLVQFYKSAGFEQTHIKLIETRKKTER